MKISVFVITRDEERNIERCLRSAAWADEIVLVDSGSRDRTVALASKFTDKIHFHEFADYASQKNFALSKTSGDWVLSLDADEEVTDALRHEIETTARLTDPAAAYRIRRHSFIFGRRFRYTGTEEDKPVRLFKKDLGFFVQPIHEIVNVRGPVGELRSPLLHYTYPRVSDYLTRLNRYTSMEADHFFSKENKFTRGQLTVKPVLMFLRLYFWKQGWRDGIEGFFFSFLSAYYVFVKHAKHFEKMRPNR